MILGRENSKKITKNYSNTQMSFVTAGYHINVNKILGAFSHTSEEQSEN